MPVQKLHLAFLTHNPTEDTNILYTSRNNQLTTHNANIIKYIKYSV